jgi:hypothetical protein
MPSNHKWLGHICQSIPEAKIIHITRDKNAVKWSNFKTPFTSPGMQYANSINSINQYYQDYEALMKMMVVKYHSQIHEVDYEELVKNSRIVLEKIFSFLNIKFDEKSLEFHKSPRNVRTASSAQVKQPLYSGSSAEWKKYQALVPELFF